ncbi:protein-disulfide reductase DsbD [Sulfurimonas marina]|uniref:Protein-disulfide reductase DsbD n=1 Tax=Sulfurimonas marina TaxID=2590551 RepID=A0A7M1AWY5_9BACT|nr:protein-disulfide reductase DsbD [Sulfurimonas marina]QOP41098.1 protein-disulfide reductase DsbD [Sulfurimonas marina]
MKFFLKLMLVFLSFATLVNGAGFLMPDQAFQPYAKVNEKMEIEAGITLGEEIYLYEKQLKMELLNSKDVSIKNIQKPTPVEHHGDAVYLDSPKYTLTLQDTSSNPGVKDIKLKISYQGCSEQGLCYEPYSKEFDLQVDTSKLSRESAAKEEPKAETAEKSETDLISDTIKNSGFFVILATFFVFGILLSLTPCVFPMIPIISGVIISQGEGLTTRKAFVLSVVYVLAMAIAYTIAGVLAGLFGSNLQAALQTPWVVYSFAGVFVALAMSMFGFYELKLPDAIVSRVSQNSSKTGFIGVAIMGFLSALIVGPCVAAPLAGALVYIGQTGDALLGAAALFSMSIGMGLPLILVGVSAGKFMPKPGAWMTMVNATFGVIMLAVAIWMLEKVIPADVAILLYGLLGLSFALYLGAFNNEGHIFKRSVAVILFIYSLTLFLSFLAGKASLTKPLEFLAGKSVASQVIQSEELHFEVITSIAELDAVLEQNKGKKIMLDFSAEWCVACKEFDEITFRDPSVISELKDFVLVRADVTANDENTKALNKKYGVFGPPVLIFFDEELNPINAKTIVGFTEPQKFLTHLKTVY